MSERQVTTNGLLWKRMEIMKSADRDCIATNIQKKHWRVIFNQENCTICELYLLETGFVLFCFCSISSNILTFLFSGLLAASEALGYRM